MGKAPASILLRWWGRLELKGKTGVQITISHAILEMMRLVLDTAVVAAAARSSLGASRQLLLSALAGRFTLLLSVPLVLEYEAVLKRPEQLVASQATPADIDTLLDALIAIARPVPSVFSWRPLLRDPDDDMVLEVALNGQADLLVTFNIRDFEPAASRLGVVVALPREALRRLREET
jgi:putative PIN family toxin of toxin-antitoxin system